MCFSATASFGAGALLTVIGIASLKKTKHRSQYLFAGIPLIFGVQQFAEGVLWVSIPAANATRLQEVSTYLFLFFAQVVWPIWVPVSIERLEQKGKSRPIQKLWIVAGWLVGLYLGFCLVMFHVEANIKGHHIAYFQDYPIILKKYVIILYAMAIIVPPFFSHIKKMWLLGVTILISYLITILFYDQYMLSVWCFFSSIISISIYLIMRQIAKQEQAGITKPKHR
jgi:hypothetical protein